MDGSQTEIELIIDNFKMKEEWTPEIRLKIKTWLRKYYRDDPKGGMMTKELNELIDELYKLENDKESGAEGVK